MLAQPFSLPPRAVIPGAAAAQRVVTLQNELERGRYGVVESVPYDDVSSWLKAVITARTPESYNPALPPFPEEVRYACVIVEHGSIVSLRYPVYGRPAQGREARIIPQNVGETCWVVRRFDAEGAEVAEIVVLRERVARRACGSGGGGPSPAPAPGDFNPFEPTRPRPPTRPVRNTDPASNPPVPVY